MFYYVEICHMLVTLVDSKFEYPNKFVKTTELSPLQYFIVSNQREGRGRKLKAFNELCKE